MRSFAHPGNIEAGDLLWLEMDREHGYARVAVRVFRAWDDDSEVEFLASDQTLFRVANKRLWKENVR